MDPSELKKLKNKMKKAKKKAEQEKQSQQQAQARLISQTIKYKSRIRVLQSNSVMAISDITNTQS